MTEIKYFHEITADEYKELIECGLTYEQLASQHPQPEWCNYPEAIMGSMGCWSLISFRGGKCLVTGEEYCKKCDQYRPMGE